MEFAILGPLEVRDDSGALLALGKRRQRMLLAALVLRANEIVPVDALVDALWPVTKPAQPLASIHAYVAGLRRVLPAAGGGRAAADRLLTRKPGYLLRVEPGELDLDRFERAAARGREALAAGDPHAAREHLHRSLAEWRGQALADFVYEPFAERTAAHLAERRVDALEDRMRADLACGVSGVVAECESLLAEHPLRERLWELLVLALYRSGRQHDALERCQALRRTLAEVGLEPDEDLRRLETAVLNHDPALDGDDGGTGSTSWMAVRPPLPAWAVEAADGFVGRSVELGELVLRWKAALNGRTELAMLLGEPGIGKTSTASRFLATVDDGLVLAGRCTSEALVPFEPFVEALGSLVDAASGDQLAMLGAHREQLGRLLPLREDRFGRAGRHAVQSADAARYQLFAAVTALLELAAGDRSIALLLDDVQLADESTLSLLRHVLQARLPHGLFVVVTVRTTDLVEGAALQRTLTAIRASTGGRGVIELPLSGFSSEEISGYLGARFADASAARIEELARLTGGNPLFLAELVAGDQEPPGAVEAGDLPGGLRTLINARLQALPNTVRGLLQYAAVAGRRLDLGLLAEVSGQTAAVVTEQIEQAGRAGLVEETEEAIQFRHDLVREALVGSLSPARRALIHRSLGEAILLRHADRLRPFLGRLAGHFANAALDGDPARAVEFAQLAGWEAIARAGYHTAVERFSDGLRALERSATVDDEARVELTAGLAEAYRRLGEPAEARRIASNIIPLALRVRAPATTLGHLAMATAGAAWTAEERAASIGLLETVVARFDSRDEDATPDLAMILSTLASLRSTEGDHAGAADLWRRARTIAVDHGEPETVVPVLLSCSIGLLNEEPLERRIEQARQTIAAAAPTGDLELIAASHSVARFVALERGDRAEAQRHAAAYEAVVEELAMPRYLAGRAQRRAMEALLEGRFADAEQQIGETTRLQPNPEFVEGTAAQVLLVRADTGRVEEIAELVGGAATPASHVAWRAAALLAEVERDDDVAATGRLDGLLHDVLTADRDFLWLVALALTASSVAMLQRDEEAATLLAALRPELGRHVIVNDGLVYLGAIEHHVGALELTIGDAAAAGASLASAVEAHRRMGARPYEVRSQLWLSRALDALGDRSAAASLRDEALATAASLGLQDRLVRTSRAPR